MLFNEADAQHLPQGQASGGDRHLKFHESRDNLQASGHLVRSEWMPAATVDSTPTAKGAGSWKYGTDWAGS
jgi:hypothetical protein